MFLDLRNQETHKKDNDVTNDVTVVVIVMSL